MPGFFLHGARASAAQPARTAARLTRREMLAALAAIVAASRAPRAATTGPEPVPLHDVRLLDGPFLDAQQRDSAYLLSLEPDRMLHNFRVNAGLRAEGAGLRRLGIGGALGRTSVPRPHARPLSHRRVADVRIDRRRPRASSASTTSWRSCRPARRRAKRAGQRLPGWRARSSTISSQGGRSIGVPWYTLHKMFAGLRDAHVHCRQRSRRRRPASSSRTGRSQRSRQMTDDAVRTHAAHRARRHERGARRRRSDDRRYDIPRPGRPLLPQAAARSRCSRHAIRSTACMPTRRFRKVVGFQRIAALTGDEPTIAAPPTSSGRRS